MTTIQVKVPDGTDISGYDAEFRIPQSGDEYLNLETGIIETAAHNHQLHNIVLTPKWKPPEWLKPGFLFMDLNGKWWWTNNKPGDRIHSGAWHNGKMINLSLTNFQGPDVEPKDSLIEITG